MAQFWKAFGISGGGWQPQPPPLGTPLGAMHVANLGAAGNVCTMCLNEKQNEWAVYCCECVCMCRVSVMSWEDFWHRHYLHPDVPASWLLELLTLEQSDTVECWIFIFLCLTDIGWICKFTYLNTYLFTYSFFEKLTASQLVKKFPALYWTRRFSTAFTSACHLSMSWARSVLSLPTILLLSSTLRPRLPSGLPTKTLAPSKAWTTRRVHDSRQFVCTLLPTKS